MNRNLKTISAEAVDALRRYSWPGNVRELENVIERTLVLTDGDEIAPQDLPLDPPESDTGETGLNDRLATLERSLIEEALAEAGGNKTQAAGTLGIKTSALYYKLEKYGLA